METIIVSTAFILGVAGSLHCFGMCGPIAFAIAIDRNRKVKMLLQNLSYQLGRIFSYTLLGLIFGMIGYGFSIAGLQRFLSVMLGIGMMISVFIPARFFLRNYWLKPYGRLLGKLRLSLGYFIRKKTFSGLFIAGCLNGLLPCGLVYIALTAAISSGQVFSGVLSMLYFGLGTLPLMFTTVILGNFVGLQFKNKILKVVPVIVFFVGASLLLRGLELGIPYLSPPKGALHLHKMHAGKVMPSSDGHCH
ncbi:sulfite exporter TauE/SafE family protein [Bacteroidetes bacterium endosymbiont of Geopemphigus sp.]|uniref:sulfite exporter TauE/SafE family protein n=1 Tax=Bacteroidetes bacterium endosymbiont of Geopemphigus sp. TaxID=2047937 RepID=UPI000CD1114C|nr:sulfite exporter TauE/SafE family protein [Bacteroidetes bacterium endosymbiont of Geopemphigus sp.]